eukprot:scaffold2077_cov119-Cylindrotheca_fusiformis.AAC.19
MNPTKSTSLHRKRNGSSGRNSQRKRQRTSQEKTPPNLACSVCFADENPPRYKCPRCRALYCSVVCCRSHKDICIQEKKQEEKSNIPSKYGNLFMCNGVPNHAISMRVVREDHDDDGDNSIEEGWNVTQEMKQAISRSEWLRSELKDGGLRALISQIVSAGNQRHCAIQQVKERYPSFKTFLDKLLLVAGVLEHQDSGEVVETIEELLGRDWDEDPPSLALTSREMRKLPVFEPIQHSSSSSESDNKESADTSESSISSDDGDNESHRSLRIMVLTPSLNYWFVTFNITMMDISSCNWCMVHSTGATSVERARLSQWMQHRNEGNRPSIRP